MNPEDKVVFKIESPSEDYDILFNEYKLAWEYAEKHYITYRIKMLYINKPINYNIVFNKSYPVKKK